MRIGSGWTIHNLVMPVGDFDGDGLLTDLIARRTDGVLFLYAGQRPRRLPAGHRAPDRHGLGPLHRGLRPRRNYDRDGPPDLLARAADGTVYLYRGNGVGGWRLPRTTVATGWQQYTALTSPGDFTGDGKADVLARTADGAAVRHPWATGAARSPRARRSAPGWNIFATILL